MRTVFGSAEGTPQPAPREPVLVLALLAVAIALTPLVSPKGPGNATPIDALMLVAVIATVTWAWRSRAAVRVPYAIPVMAMAVAGLASAMTSISPGGGAVAVAQEIFLLSWCAAIATACRTPRAIGMLLRVWALSVAAWAAVLVAAVLLGSNAISGVPGKGVGRAQLFFDHPNMAANYFMLGIFAVVASGCPRRVWARIGVCLLILAAMFLTGSNAALLSLVIGGVVTIFFHTRARRGLVTAIAVVLVLVAGLGVAWTQAAVPLITAAQQSDDPLLRYSIGRSTRSADARTSLFASQLEIYQQSSVHGIGPSATRDVLGDVAATKVKEAHNDYLATLVERGPLGVLGLVGLIGVIWARVVRVTRRRLPPSLAAAVPVPGALAGACVAFALTAVTHEILHYRWLWTLLALIAALHLLSRPRPRPLHLPDPSLPPAGGADRPSNPTARSRAR